MEYERDLSPYESDSAYGRKSSPGKRGGLLRYNMVHNQKLVLDSYAPTIGLRILVDIRR